MGIKLIAIDIDGTLLDSNGNLPIENKKAIAEAKAVGVKIILCTGRPLQSMLHFIEELNLFDSEDLVVTNNGGLIQYARTGEIIYEHLFNREEILDIYQLSQRLNMPVNFIDSNYIYEPAYPLDAKSIYTGGNLPKENGLEFIKLEINSLPKDFKVNQIIISRPAEELAAVISQIPKSYYQNYTISQSLSFILEFLPKNVHKRSALKIVREHFNYERYETMAIGDQENDLSLIKTAGIGVAMDNGIEEVKKAADYVTKSNDENGLAYAIRKFVL